MIEHAIGIATAVRAAQPLRERAFGPPSRGYRHAAYAAALEDLGRPRRLHEAGAWILERSIGSRSDRDACGCYPLFACDR